MKFTSIIFEDFINNSFRSFLILFFYRILHFLYTKKYFLFLKIVNIIFEILKILFNLNAQISYKAKIGRNIRLPHIGFGVVISSKAVIGNNVTIYHLVTIGINEKKKEQFVIIEDNVYISTGAKIINCKVGKHSIIGPNAVVYKNIPSYSKVFNGVIIR